MADVIIIGAGHNGLVTACYLAKHGHKVMSVEKRSIVGGCCTTDATIFPGFKISSAAYVNGLFLPQIVEDLKLREYGYEVLPREPSSFTPLPNGNFLFLGSNRKYNINQIMRHSMKDALRYPYYEATLDALAQFISRTLTMTPPNVLPRSAEDYGKIIRIAWDFFKLGPARWGQFVKLFTEDAICFLDQWFESDALKATLLNDSTIGATNFNSYLLLHLVMAEAGGTRGVWGYQRGGMGGLTQALASAARDLGVKIYTDRPVREIILSGNTAQGVLFDDNRVWAADVVVSNADPKRTFTELVPPQNGKGELAVFQRKIEALDFSSAVMKVNLALSGIPDFSGFEKNKIGPQHRGTIHVAPSVAYIQKAAEDGKRGIPSTEPILEITIPSAVDHTLAPRGCHVMNIFVQYTPYHLRKGSWDTLKETYFTEHVLKVLRRYIENIDTIIQGVQILSPLDLEREFSLTGGNIFHGAMGRNQLFFFRPIRGYADYRTPIKNLYLCGAGTHPGGGVMGANGFNAAREIIKDLQNV